MLTIYILCGANSSEHDISLRSAKNIFLNINKEKYDVKMVYIDKKGCFSTPFVPENLDSEFNLVQDIGLTRRESIIEFLKEVDTENSVVIGAVHGTFGEDGTLEGFLDTLGFKYVGNSLLSSAICMDKETTNDVFFANNIKQARYKSIKSHELSLLDDKKLKEIADYIDFPMIVKPSANGSSIGVMRARNEEELLEAIKNALQYDKKCLIEQEMPFREIEIAVIGNTELKSSVAASYLTKRELLDYHAKYFDSTTLEELPFKMPKEHLKKAKEIAEKAYSCCNCRGFARVDMFYDDKNGEFYVNEINTFPGFTPSSFFHRLMKESYDMDFTTLLDEIIALAL